MTHSGGADRNRSRIGRPYRRLRRWGRHTPNGDIALVMLGVGAALVVVALVIAVVAL
ncbi:hypothetical protein [Jatrophihabitans endophyticus]|uniref:hypothetical protein n=1 Tax=Jatrophihabitans endophyticus TaxID=1206085 RepID=UPI001A0BDF27|nr:hypothetical protein [Jatrophihabitans endophyticus]MBE7189781.1 hypothetical protein [Jatrophihabitans endophyticus]